MKKIIKNNLNYLIISFIMCLISSTIGAYAAKTYLADQIIYASEYGVDKTLDNALDDLYYASSNFANPTGTVISVMRNHAPEGYLKCDGSVYNISEYKKLADMIEEEFGKINYFGGNGTTTFAVPDLRGEFLRGTGTNNHSNQGSGANVGIHQNATISSNVRVHQDNTLHAGANGTYVSSNFDSTISTVSSLFWVKYNGVYQVDEIGTYTSRPTNTSVLYCIKY